MKRTIPLFLAALMACTILVGPALAVEDTTAPPTVLYPVDIVEHEDGAYRRLEKVYALTVKDDPAGIPTGDFEREGYHYTLLDLTQQERTETDSRYHTEIVTLDSDSKDMDKILPQLAATCEITTEDNYTGVLTLDTASIKVEAAGYKTSSRNVTATRNYPNLSDADTALLPKTTQEGGRTLTLADVQWQEAGGLYHATASYTGTATSQYATGYKVTANYTGEVFQTDRVIVTYTAVFSGTPINGTVQTVEETDGPVEAETPVSFNWKWLLVLPAAAGVGGLGFGGKVLYQKLKSKKEWSEYTK